MKVPPKEEFISENWVDRHYKNEARVIDDSGDDSLNMLSLHD